MPLIVDVVIGLSVGAIPFAVLRGPLDRILIDLCGTEVRASFWARYTWLVVFLTPLLTTLGNPRPGAGPLDSAALENSLRAAVFGVLLAVAVVGVMLVRMIRDQDAAKQRPPERANSVSN